MIPIQFNFDKAKIAQRKQHIIEKRNIKGNSKITSQICWGPSYYYITRNQAGVGKAA